MGICLEDKWWAQHVECINIDFQCLSSCNDEVWRNPRSVPRFLTVSSLILCPLLNTAVMSMLGKGKHFEWIANNSILRHRVCFDGHCSNVSEACWVYQHWFPMSLLMPWGVLAKCWYYGKVGISMSGAVKVNPHSFPKFVRMSSCKLRPKLILWQCPYLQK